MKNQEHPKNTSPSAAKASNTSPTTGTTAGSSKKPAAKRKMFSDRVKEQLQEKSRARRKGQAAKTRVVGAASRPARNDIQPRLVVIEKPLADLQPSPNRARVTTPEQLEKVITSIRQFGLVMPVLIDRNDMVISGHVICEAAEQLGFETVPCLSVEHLDEVEIEALALALNRVGETGTWDTDLLREQMIRLESAGIDLTNTGFTLPEIDQITILSEPAEGDGDEDEFEEDEDDMSVISRLGDLYQLGVHRLHCADALEMDSYVRLLAGELAQCIFSDPPYGCEIEGFVSGLGKHKHLNFLEGAGDMDRGELQEFFTAYLGHCKAFSSAGAIIFACMDWRQIDILLLAAMDVGLTRKNIAVWDKGSGGMGGLYRNAHEFVAVFCNGNTPATNNIQLGRHGRDRCNIWRYPGANRPGSSSAKALADHPTPKPEPLVEDALLDVTNRGDIVLDPFIGSGSTILAAESTGRICRGIELDPKYVDRAIRRWERETGIPAIHIETGLTFDELARVRLSEREASHG
ncbi:site-specific DNA-methyltransferase [Altererythrobacter sp. BO-6]|uniref:site-specific DNA-methyltransferase n=1 Tax=Altererythrobacter sp. BO-6 TaxID=2604537 RepID=UPI0013E113C3|nr:site-specific DNA-methyltransferase [Altererythrobacter sp. BO-6]QIG53652.1 site-specific DNA-methyltransferase [Altererythrobacter sp. BO-6]